MLHGRNVGGLTVIDDTLSGAKAERSGLASALGYLRDGDVRVVWRLERMGAPYRI